ncbi:lactonase family protein [Mucilaginibacter sp. dw_454]|uniref:lactonase family protein n=1 Tax=Mucilaginibacter sp. dw_454 TaxID=2720079 RepID=UPI001BD6CE88|nr:lactonase family protein [Mucilaginibacter sp. dw_454]
MKKLLIILLVLPLLGLAQQKTAKTYDLLLGGYTTDYPGSKGIAVYRFDTKTGTVSFLNQFDSVDNPDFLAISNDHKFVYSCDVDTKGGEARVSAFKFDVASGKLELINSQPAGGINTVHIILDNENKHVILSHYSSGSLTVLPVNKDGSVGPVSQTIQYTGSGPHKNQKGPHVHSAMIAADGKKILVADLGTDHINVYDYDAGKAKPIIIESVVAETTNPGDGPRHMEFSPDKKFLYVIQELSAFVRVYKYDNGKLTFVQAISMMPADFAKNSAADVHLSPDGNFLYASNRGGANNIVQYAVNKQDGKLTFADRFDVSKAPRGFTIDPSGNYLLSAGQEGNEIIIFKIDKTTGKLTLTDNKIDIPQVVCLKWVPAE